MNRRQFMNSSLLAAAATSFLPGNGIASGLKKNKPLEVRSEENYTLFFQPSKLWKDRNQGFSAWTHSIAVRDGQMVNAVGVRQFFIKEKTEMMGASGKTSLLGLAIAVSDDGVHWREIIDFTCPVPGAAGYCLRWTGREFIYFSSERNTASDSEKYPLVLRQYRSTDMKTWTFMGDEYTTRPEKQWYSNRWDEMAILKDKNLFYGYITSIPHPHLAQDSMGMLRSADGIRWEVIPPPVFEWDDVPPQHMEVGFCERINGRYYLGMASRCYLGHLGCSIMTFVSDSPTGPFRPDKDAFRLCGNTSRDTNWIAKTFHWNDEILLSNWITTSLDKSFPTIWGNGQSLWIGPLKKLSTDAKGHLRIAWWKGNDKAKAHMVSLNQKNIVFEHPSQRYLGTLNTLNLEVQERIAMTAGHDGAIALLPVNFDFKQGVILEGNIKATELRKLLSTHWHPAAAGFFFEEMPGKGMLIQLETLGLTRIGIFEFRPEPSFDAFEYRLAAWGNMQRGGLYQGLSRFIQEDVVGPMGFAPPCGVRNNVSHSFRIIVKQGMFELYLDDLMVQTYITGETSGRLGLFAKSGAAEFGNIKIWGLTPDSMGK
jgi:hypothetical protein